MQFCGNDKQFTGCFYQDMEHVQCSTDRKNLQDLMKQVISKKNAQALVVKITFDTSSFPGGSTVCVILSSVPICSLENIH